MPAEYFWPYVRVVIAERTGWTLEYIDCLRVSDIQTILAVWDGRARAEKHRLDR